MITNLKLTNFKSFGSAELAFGPITTVIGTNASGKSNLRDAFRFLHGIARGYTLADIIGEKYGQGGYKEWNGIRGGVKEISRFGTGSFSLEVTIKIDYIYYRYHITVNTNSGKGPLYVERESLYWFMPLPEEGVNACYTNGACLIFDSHCHDDPTTQDNPLHLAIRFPKGKNHRKYGPTIDVLSQQPAISQLIALAEVTNKKETVFKELSRVRQVLRILESIRFVDFSPEAMRRPSTPGQTLLTDQGENLSSVLQAICADPAKKAAMISRLSDLTPMEVADLDFIEDAQGKIILQIIETDGRKVSANSASDGTLRFLGIVAALVGPTPASFYMLEEIDNGIHPVRMHLLFNFLDKQTRSGAIQVFTTTHSPQWLRFMSPERLENVSLAYRVEGVPESKLISLDKIEHLKEILESKDIARLYEGGWMEESLFYKEGVPEPIMLEDAPSDQTL